MAFPAIDCLVFSFQGKGGFIVFCHGKVPYGTKGFFAVTSLAVFSKNPVMDILMAGNALTDVSIDKVPEHPVRAHFCIVTFSTVDCPVLTQEREAGFIVIKVFHATEEVEGFLDMTFLAVGAKTAIVRISVTFGALVEFYSCKLLEGGAIAFRDGMTGCAIHILMGTFQREVRLIMRE